MTQVLIDRATLEQMVNALEAVLDDSKYANELTVTGGVYEGLQCKEALTAGRAALANAEQPACLWSKDPDFEMGDTYDSACGEKWSFIDGGPTENRVSFCQGCGKPVKLVQDTL